jgi:hypothetical protein
VSDVAIREPLLGKREYTFCFFDIIGLRILAVIRYGEIGYKGKTFSGTPPATPYPYESVSGINEDDFTLLIQRGFPYLIIIEYNFVFQSAYVRIL